MNKATLLSLLLTCNIAVIPAQASFADSPTAAPITAISAPSISAKPETSAPVQASQPFMSAPQMRRQHGSAERQARNEERIERLDALITSRDFQFVPVSMQEIPQGSMMMINNFYYYIGVFKNQVQVHIPTVGGRVVGYFEILNFDTSDVQNYQTSKTPYGWNISFNATSDKQIVYTFSFNVNTVTGEVTVNMLVGEHSIKYLGTLSPNEPQEP